jgi:glycosyltransferase involved in cell wall biosynthesis
MVVARLKELQKASRLKLAATKGQIEVHKDFITYRKYLRRPQHKKTALLVFLRQPLILEAQGQKTKQFSNTGMIQTVAKCLNVLGYEVDIVDWDNRSFVPTKNYDLFIAHGGVNFHSIHSKLKGSPTVIYFSTGSYWKFHNLQETKRFKYFEERHGIDLKPDRFISSSEEEANRSANAIIAMGESFKTYSDFPNVYRVNNATLTDKTPLRSEIELSKARNNFLFFSGPGSIHKGLDLLLDAFIEMPNLHLYICSVLDKDFEQYYKKQLTSSDNIHYLGFVVIGSREYYDILRRCAFCVLPSCSEGHPGSVIDCMQHGLIPIVTKDAHIDVAQSGIILKDDRVETIKKEIIDMSQEKPERLVKLSRRAADQASAYSAAAFESDFINIIKRITD